MSHHSLPPASCRHGWDFIIQPSTMDPKKGSEDIYSQKALKRSSSISNPPLDINIASIHSTSTTTSTTQALRLKPKPEEAETSAPAAQEGRTISHRAHALPSAPRLCRDDRGFPSSTEQGPRKPQGRVVRRDDGPNNHRCVSVWEGTLPHHARRSRRPARGGKPVLRRALYHV
jgi:hypothetical protein